MPAPTHREPKARLADPDPTSADTPAPSRRIQSLDVVRGLMLVVNVGVTSVLVATGQWTHAEWEGPHLIDLIFPVFVTLTGCGLAFALRKGVRPVPLIRRAIVLVVIGLLYNAVTTNEWALETWRLPGVLQLYAGVVLLVGLGHLITRSWWGWLILTLLVAVGHCVLLGWWARDCPDQLVTAACNPSGLIDAAVFGRDHILAAGDVGYDPEGLVSVLGALISAGSGAVIGHLLRPAGVNTVDPRRVVPRVLGVAVILAVAGVVLSRLSGVVWGYQIPAIKKLWTAPFALWIAAGTVLVLLSAYLVFDRGRTPALVARLSLPVRAMGLNSLFVYFGSHVVMALLWLNPGLDDEPSYAERIADAITVGGYRQASWTVLAIALWMTAAVVLHRRRIYLRP